MMNALNTVIMKAEWAKWEHAPRNPFLNWATMVHKFLVLVELGMPPRELATSDSVTVIGSESDFSIVGSTLSAPALIAQAQEICLHDGGVCKKGSNQYCRKERCKLCFKVLLNERRR